jgi:peptidoglycan/xylan/chitin deacetylase (PgdA/CDA1 family)
MFWLKQWGFTPLIPNDWCAWHTDGGPLPEKPMMITFDDGYADLTQFAFPILQELAFCATVFLPTARIACTNDWDRDRGAPTMNLLSADDLVYWHTRGITFGAHSRHHVDLTSIDCSTLADETVGSNDELTSLLGKRVCAFSYPWGQYNEVVESSVSSCFRLAFTTEEGVNKVSTNPYRLRRTMVRPEDGRFALFCRVRFGYYPVQTWCDGIQLRTRIRKALELCA